MTALTWLGWIATGLAVWTAAVSVPVGVVLGRVLLSRDRQIPHN